jgi:uncharacterized membrane protein
MDVSIHAVFGLSIPDAGPYFLAVLAVHVTAAVTAVGAGALAATARKRPGRHPRAGRIYLYALGVAALSATVMAVIRWRHDAHLFGLAVLASLLAGYGYRARRQRRPGWAVRHGIGMAGSYMALLTAFYVDNGPFLPVWDRLPHLTYWLAPLVVGVPVTWIGLRRSSRVDAWNCPREAVVPVLYPDPSAPID